MTTTTKVICGVLVLGACTANERQTVGTADQTLVASTIVHAVQQGRDASFSSYDGYAWYSVDVFETGVGANQGAFLDYSIIVPDPSSPTVFDMELGFGTIPTSDLVIAAGLGSASLNTTTGPGFTVQTCTDDVSPGGLFTCTTTTGVPRSFDLEWDDNHAYSWGSTGTSRFTQGRLSYLTTGTTRGNSANVNGTAFDRSLSDLAGTISDSGDTEISHDVVLANP